MTFKLFKKYLKENPEFEREHPRVPRGSSEGGEFTEKKFGIRPPNRLTPSQEREVVHRYLTKAKPPESMLEIAKHFGVSETCIRGILSRYGIKSRHCGPPRGKYIKDDAFKDVEKNPESAYWVGFLMADGCIPQTLKSIQLGLDVESRPHLEKFQTFLGSNFKIRDTITRLKGRDEDYPANVVSVYSKKIVDDLKRYGVVPNKSFRAGVKVLENNPHFWRGVIDGDGSISKNNMLEFGCSSLELVTQFRDFVVNHNHSFEFSGKIEKQHDKEYYRIRLARNATFVILKILGYDDPQATVLEKNKNKALKIIHGKKPQGYKFR